MRLTHRQQADLNRKFEEHWGVKLPSGVNVTKRKSDALCSPAPHEHAEMFSMLFQATSPPHSVTEWIDMCDTWNTLVAAYLREVGADEQ